LLDAVVVDEVRRVALLLVRVLLLVLQVAEARRWAVLLS
jgi:hypothetical protein